MRASALRSSGAASKIAIRSASSTGRNDAAVHSLADSFCDSRERTANKSRPNLKSKSLCGTSSRSHGSAPGMEGGQKLLCTTGRGRISFGLVSSEVYPVTLNIFNQPLAGTLRSTLAPRLDIPSPCREGATPPPLCTTLPGTKALMAKPTFALSPSGLCGGLLVRVLRGMLGICDDTSGSLGRFDAGFKLLPATSPSRPSPAVRPTLA